VPNPDIEVKLSSAYAVACGTTSAENISFDRFDRIAGVAASAPYWSCR
jgi:hypothetical protein